MKRTLTQTAAILNIVVYSLMAIGYAFISFISFIFSDLGADIDAIIGGAFFTTIASTLIFISLPLLVVSILQIIFSSKILKVISASKEKFAKSFGIIITSIVFSSIYVVFIVINMISTNVVNIISILELIAFVLIITFFIVDMAKNKNHDDYVTPLTNTQQTPLYSDSSVEIDRNYHKTAQTSSDLEQKLKRLTSLKQQGMISQEEFEKLRQSAIKKELNN